MNNDPLPKTCSIDSPRERVRRFFNQAPPLSWAARSYRRLLAHYYNLIIPASASVLEIGCGEGDLLAGLNARDLTGVDFSETQLARARARIPHAALLCQEGEALDLGDKKYDFIIISDTLNHVADVQHLLGCLLAHSHEATRLVTNCHNTLWRPLFSLANLFGWRRHGLESSWLSRQDLVSLSRLAGWDPIKTQARLLLPVSLGFVSSFFNRWMAPLFPWACLTVFMIARPAAAGRPGRRLSVSVVVPARNEAGNIEAAILRTPDMGAWTELIFIEGHSSDDTWARIREMKSKYPARRIKILQQSGQGKGNAVREAFAVAEGDVLMILDADLTVPPEELPKFYEALASGYCDFANGCRLVYPMEEHAMQFLNLMANKTFGILFTWMLAQPVKDTLCGTKVLTRANYLKLSANRAYFGNFDPFGDFDLLFGSDKLSLKICDIPIRYRERTYGSTNIHRWRHGLLLLRMVLFAARKLKFV
jgi:SAM-dependent methyltransferase